MHPTDAGPLLELGWDTTFAGHLAALGDPTLEPGRVVADHGARLLVQTAGGVEPAELGRLLRAAGRPVAVGDWAGLGRRSGGRLEIQAVLERRSAIRRKVPQDEAREQVLAANVDLVFIATALDHDFNERRIERLLTLASQSGAAAAVLLTKADLRPPGPALAAVARVPGVPALAVSARTGEGVAAVREQVGPGRTAVLLGSSGVGKSTLVNRLLAADVLRTGETHRGGKGRHTTSHRALLPLPGGGAVIDTPGLREVQLWAGEEALEDVFEDVGRLELECRFSDCSHRSEPGCAVRQALREGILDPARWASYEKLRRELRRVESRVDARLRAEEVRRWKALQQAGRDRMRARRGLQ